MIKDALGLGAMTEGTSKALVKLIEVIQVGLGGAFAPWQRVRLARADAAAALIEANGQVQIEQLRLAGQRELEALRAKSRLPPAGIPQLMAAPGDGNGEVVEAQALEERTHSRFDFQETKRQLNVEQVAAEALLALQGREANSEPVDADWTARFFDSVKDISNADMQRLWAKLLAGEVVQPGRFSLRTLERLRTLTSAEAKLFSLSTVLCERSGRITIPHDFEGKDIIANALVVSPKQLVRLVDAGLLHAGDELLWGSSGEPFKKVLKYTHANIVISSNQERNFWGAWEHQLTTTGLELINLEPPQTSAAFVDAIVETAKAYDFDVERRDRAPKPSNSRPEVDSQV